MTVGLFNGITRTEDAPIKKHKSSVPRAKLKDVEAGLEVRLSRSDKGQYTKPSGELGVYCPFFVYMHKIERFFRLNSFRIFLGDETGAENCTILMILEP